MSGRKRKVVFSPSTIKDSVVRRKDASHDVIARAQEFIQAVHRLSAEDVDYVCSKCDDIATQLVLTAKVGLDACEALKFACSHVPDNFLSDKKERVHDIVLEVCGKSGAPPLDMKLCDSVASVLQTRLPRYWKRKPVRSAYAQELKSLTERKGVSYFHFLSPPVDKCTNSACILRGKASLLPHHSAINVVVFTLNGPCAATKLSLRCTSCSMVYNYCMHGHKRGEGEILYGSMRPLVEVSDAMYVERNLYELFCSLRLGRHNSCCCSE